MGESQRFLNLGEYLLTKWCQIWKQEQLYTLRPLLHHTPATEKNPERVVIQYARRGFTGFLHLPRSSNIPPITEAQAEALDALYFLAEKFSVTLDFQKGDVQ
jgi:hypothetical protein